MSNFEYSDNELIDYEQSLYRLMNNKDFQLLILNYYTRNYVLELTDALNDYAMDSDMYKEYVRKLDAISLFTGFLNKVKQDGQFALDNINYHLANPYEE